MTSKPLTIDDLIKTHNPFAGHTVVRPPQIWGKSFPDVPSINAHASNAVFQAVSQIRQGHRQTVGITITAEKGLGKSHIISRIRHRLRVDGNALFIYVNKYDNLNQIKYQFLQNLISSLRGAASQGVMQCQDLAVALINEAKKTNYTPEQCVAAFPSWFSKHSTYLVDNLTEAVLQVKPEVHNPYIVRAILWTLYPNYAVYATHWLSGQELTQGQANALGLPLSRKEDREAEALNTARELLDLSSNYKVPVICFDELDNLDANEQGFTTAMVVGSFAKDLYNTLNRGLILLAMYPETWRDQIRAVPQADAVMDRLGGQPITLEYLNADDVVATVSQWLKAYYEEHKQTPHHPLYPFEENKLRDLGKQKPSTRAVLKWCAENFTIDLIDRVIDTIPPNLIEDAFKTELQVIAESLEDLLENNSAIADALYLSFYALKGEILEKVKIEDIEEFDTSSSYLDFKIVGKEEGKTIKIGLVVVQQAGGVGVLARLRQLINYKYFGITRGCLVRSRKIGSGATQARECLKTLLHKKGGEWVMLRGQDIKPLLALESLYQHCENYDLVKDKVLDFIKQKAINNPLIREILSNPSGQEPDLLIDDEIPLSIPKDVPELKDTVDLKI